jgi:hypothetical protein
MANRDSKKFYPVDPLIVMVVVALASAACNGVNETSQAGIAHQSKAALSTTVPRQLSLVDVSKPARSDEEITRKAAPMLQLLLGRDPGALAVGSEVEKVTTLAATSESFHRKFIEMTASTEVSTEISTEVRATYNSRDDALETTYLEPRRDHDPDKGVATKDEAQKLFMEAYERLASAGLFERDRLPLAGVVYRTRRQSEGTSTQGILRSWIAEHLFFVPIEMNGAHVGDETREFGLMISVHKSRKIVRIQLSGMATANSEPGALVARATVDNVLGGQKAHDLSASVYPGAKVRDLGLRYVLPLGLSGSMIAPRQLVGVAPPLLGEHSGGYGKEYVFAYDVTGVAKSPDVWPKPGSLAPTIQSTAQ